jgi:hypothetical protein
MRKLCLLFLLLCIVQYACQDTHAKAFKKTAAADYRFCDHYDPAQTIAVRIPVPEGYSRVNLPEGSFGEWLRSLPLKPKNSQVHLYNGKLKSNQNVHYAVVDIDAGTVDLQQCADAVIRMRAEYLYTQKDYENLHFNFTSGFRAEFKKWSQGYRIKVKGNNVSWVKTAAMSDSYPVFKEYLLSVFNYAGTSSLSKELKPVSDVKDMQVGDVFILGGFPGHTVLVVDMCENKKTGEKLFMIQQSYMPAQEIHILKNYNNGVLSPWYSLNFKGDLLTPEWTFSRDQLKRF